MAKLGITFLIWRKFMLIILVIDLDRCYADTNIKSDKNTVSTTTTTTTTIITTRSLSNLTSNKTTTNAHIHESSIGNLNLDDFTNSPLKYEETAKAMASSTFSFVSNYSSKEKATMSTIRIRLNEPFFQETAKFFHTVFSHEVKNIRIHSQRQCFQEGCFESHTFRITAFQKPNGITLKPVSPNVLVLNIISFDVDILGVINGNLQFLLTSLPVAGQLVVSARQLIISAVFDLQKSQNRIPFLRMQACQLNAGLVDTRVTDFGLLTDSINLKYKNEMIAKSKEMIRSTICEQIEQIIKAQVNVRLRQMPRVLAVSQILKMLTTIKTSTTATPTTANQFESRVDNNNWLFPDQNKWQRMGRNSQNNKQDSFDYVHPRGRPYVHYWSRRRRRQVISTDELKPVIKVALQSNEQRVVSGQQQNEDNKNIKWKTAQIDYYGGTATIREIIPEQEEEEEGQEEEEQEEDGSLLLSKFNDTVLKHHLSGSVTLVESTKSTRQQKRENSKNCDAQNADRFHVNHTMSGDSRKVQRSTELEIQREQAERHQSERQQTKEQEKKKEQHTERRQTEEQESETRQIIKQQIEQQQTEQAQTQRQQIDSDFEKFSVRNIVKNADDMKPKNKSKNSDNSSAITEKLAINATVSRQHDARANDLSTLLEFLDMNALGRIFLDMDFLDSSASADAFSVGINGEIFMKTPQAIVFSEAIEEPYIVIQKSSSSFSSDWRKNVSKSERDRELFAEFDAQQAPFRPFRLKFPHVNARRKTLEIAISEYTPNLLLFQAHRARLLKVRVGANTPLFGNLLRTSCSVDEVCLSDSVPEVNEKFPNEQLELLIETIRAPKVFIKKDSAVLHFVGAATFYLTNTRKAIGRISFVGSAQIHSRMSPAIENHLELMLKLTKLEILENLDFFGLSAGTLGGFRDAVKGALENAARQLLSGGVDTRPFAAHLQRYGLSDVALHLTKDGIILLQSNVDVYRFAFERDESEKEILVHD